MWCRTKCLDRYNTPHRAPRKKNIVQIDCSRRPIGGLSCRIGCGAGWRNYCSRGWQESLRLRIEGSIGKTAKSLQTAGGWSGRDRFLSSRGVVTFLPRAIGSVAEGPKKLHGRENSACRRELRLSGRDERLYQKAKDHVPTALGPEA